MIIRRLGGDRNSMKRIMILLASIFALAAVLAGCGGGGGTTPPPQNNFVLTGRVEDVGTGDNIVGATVKVGTGTTTTNSQGQFTLSFTSRPIVTTYSVDGWSAGPHPEGYWRTWAKVDGTAYDAMEIPLPVAPATGMDLGAIYLQNKDVPPPIVFD